MNQHIPERLLAERKRLGQTQSGVSATTGVSRATVAAYENGKTTADAEYLANLAVAGFDIHYILTGRSAAEAAVDAFDWEIAEELLEGIEQFARSSALSLSAAMKVRLLRVLLPQAVRDRRLNSTAIAAALKLVA
jgi:transcriptional regulator with XRE-family HTH domain